MNRPIDGDPRPQPVPVITPDTPIPSFNVPKVNGRRPLELASGEHLPYRGAVRLAIAWVVDHATRLDLGVDTKFGTEKIISTIKEIAGKDFPDSLNLQGNIAQMNITPEMHAAHARIFNPNKQRGFSEPAYQFNYNYDPDANSNSLPARTSVSRAAGAPEIVVFSEAETILLEVFKGKLERVEGMMKASQALESGIPRAEFAKQFGLTTEQFNSLIRLSGIQNPHGLLSPTDIVALQFTYLNEPQYRKMGQPYADKVNLLITTAWSDLQKRQG